MSMRTHWCGELRAEHVGQQVVAVRLGGAPARARRAPRVRRPARPHRRRAVRRRRRPRPAQRVRRAGHRHRARPARGHRQRRPAPPARSRSATARSRCCRAAEPPPFPIDDRADDVDETVRLRHRYLDLRRERMQRNLRVRADGEHAPSAARWSARASSRSRRRCSCRRRPRAPASSSCRRACSRARFYALPQSPQLFKQLLMVGGVDRYYQIARCLRDEDLRADRQFEFMQLDAESQLRRPGRRARRSSPRRCSTPPRRSPASGPATIPRITWHEAMERFGIDKPDLRFGMELVELTDGVRGDRVQARSRRRASRASASPGRRRRSARNKLDALTDRAKQLGRQGPGVDAGRRRTARSTSPVAKFLSDDEQAGAASTRLGAEPGDLLLLVADERPHVVRGARAAAHRPRPAAGARGPASATCGSSTSRCSSASTDDGPPDAGPPPVHHARTPTTSTGSSPTRCRCASRPTTSCSTGGSSARAASGSTSPTSSSGSSTCSASTPEEADRALRLLPRRRSATAPRPTAASPSASTAWSPSSPARRTSARSSPSRRPQSGADPLTGAPTPVDARQLAELGLRLLPPKA